MEHTKIASPCVSVCKTDPISGYCYGCGRTNDEKLLWKDAYQNAVEDRETANILVSDLLLQMTKSLTNHQSYGSIMSKYLERMSKSNDQILKLAELISKEDTENTISADDIFEEIKQ